MDTRRIQCHDSISNAVACVHHLIRSQTIRATFEWIIYCWLLLPFVVRDRASDYGDATIIQSNPKPRMLLHLMWLFSLSLFCCKRHDQINEETEHFHFCWILNLLKRCQQERNHRIFNKTDENVPNCVLPGVFSAFYQLITVDRFIPVSVNPIAIISNSTFD